MPANRLALIIDDEEPVRDAVADILTLIEVGTITAANGHDGVTLYRERQAEIGVVLLDLKMPGMDGDATLAALQAIDPDVRVILSSGFAENDVARQFAGRGVADFLQKPYDIQTLLAKVQALLDA